MTQTQIFQTLADKCQTTKKVAKDCRGRRRRLGMNKACTAGGTLLVALLMAACGRTTSSRSLRVGLGEQDITPPLGLPMAGFAARKGVSSGIHDPLHARSLVVDNGSGRPVALVTVSVVSLNRPFIDEIRSRVEQQTGIPAKNILISATHTHSGPQLGRGAATTYTAKLIEGCVASVVTAWKNRVPGRIGISSIMVHGVGFNRRRLLYGGEHPDPQVGIIKVEDARGNLLGVAFNFGCHPATLDWRNLQYTEDWPYYAIQGIKSALGKAVWAAFYQSAEGNINTGYYSELSAIGANIPTRTFVHAERTGLRMAEMLVAALPAIKTTTATEIEAVSAPFQLSLREHLADPLKQAEQKAAEARKRLAAVETRAQKGEVIGNRFLDQVRCDSFLADLNLSTANWFYDPKREASLRVELQAIRIGDAVFVSFPGEVFAEIGLRVKQKSPFAKTFVVGLVGGGAGYLPTAEEFPEGGYEVVGSHYSEKAADQLVESSLQLIRQLGKQ